MMYDFATLKLQDPTIAGQLRDNLICKLLIVDFLK